MNYFSFIFLVFTLLHGNVQAQYDTYEVDQSWPKDQNLKLGEVPGVTVDSDDNVWIFHRGTGALQVFSNTGEKLKSPLNELEFSKPHQVRVLKGDVWTVDQGSHVVDRLSKDHPLTLGTRNESGDDELHFNQPTDVTIGKNGDIYVSDGYVNSRIVQFNSTGKFIRAWGKKGSMPGEFRVPHAIVADSHGDLYVADRSNQRIQVFSESGEFQTEWKFIVPWGLWITNDDKIFVCGSSPFDASKLSLVERGFSVTGMLGLPPRDQIVMKVSTDGKIEGTWKFPDAKWIHGIALDSKGNLFLSEIQGHRVQKYIPR